MNWNALMGVPVVNACDTFTYFGVLEVGTAQVAHGPRLGGGAAAETRADDELPPPKRATSNELRGDTRLMNLLRSGIVAGADDDGWAHLGGVGSTIQKQSPDFDPRNWSYAKLGDMIKAVGLFEVDRFVEPSGHTNRRVKIPKR